MNNHSCVLANMRGNLPMDSQQPQPQPHDIDRGGGGRKLRALKKIAYPPPTLQGLPAQKQLSRHNRSIWKKFYPGAQMEFFAPNVPLHIGMY